MQTIWAVCPRKTRLIAPQAVSLTDLRPLMTPSNHIVTLIRPANANGKYRRAFAGEIVMQPLAMGAYINLRPRLRLRLPC
jgi:hypothetical protein